MKKYTNSSPANFNGYGFTKGTSQLNLFKSISYIRTRREIENHAVFDFRFVLVYEFYVADDGKY